MENLICAFPFYPVQHCSSPGTMPQLWHLPARSRISLGTEQSKAMLSSPIPLPQMGTLPLHLCQRWWQVRLMLHSCSLSSPAPVPGAGRDPGWVKGLSLLSLTSPRTAGPSPLHPSQHSSVQGRTSPPPNHVLDKLLACTSLDPAQRLTEDAQNILKA